MNSRRAEDLEVLGELLELETLSPEEREAFADMKANLDARYHQLTEKQRAWAAQRLGKPTYENLVSSGKVSRESKVQLMVRDKPLRPPVRRGE